MNLRNKAKARAALRRIDGGSCEVVGGLFELGTAYRADLKDLNGEFSQTVAAEAYGTSQAYISRGVTVTKHFRSEREAIKAWMESDYNAVSAWVASLNGNKEPQAPKKVTSAQAAAAIMKSANYKYLSASLRKAIAAEAKG